MEAILKSFTDPYARKARLYPGFLAFLPVLIAIALYTDWLNFEPENALVIAVGTAVLFWLASVSRQRGKAVEEALLQEWTHFPSVTMLRHRDRIIDVYTTERYHRTAERIIPGLAMPTEDDEATAPNDADERYRSVTKALLARTRDTKKYDLLFKENVNYGFQRNLLGLKPIAITIVTSVVAFSIWRGWDLISAYNLPDGKELATIFVTLAIGAVWLVNVTRRSVRRVAESYAFRLLEALEAQ